MRTTAPIGPVLASAGVLLYGINSDDFRNVVSNFNGDESLLLPGGNPPPDCKTVPALMVSYQQRVVVH